MAGVSRSASVIVAYLIKEQNMKFIDAIALLKKARSIVSPNIGFVQQLKKFESTVMSTRQ